MKKQKRFSSEAEERGFTLPVLHKASHWYVDFYARHPETGEMKRKRYTIPMYLPPREKKERASFLISRLTQQLMEGWSPWNDERTNNGIHGFTLFSKCIALYLETVNSKGRKKTKDNYQSRMNILMLFVDSTDNKIKYAWEFDVRFCKCFIEWLINTRHVCPRTANNYRGWLHGLGEFLVNHRFIIRNPVNKLPILPEHEKIRKDIDEDMLARLAEYLKENDQFFYLACLMEYYTMIRPSELVNLKVGDIHIEKQAIYVDGSFSKNYRSSLVGLNDAIMRVIIHLDIASYPSDYFLFSDYFMPGKVQRRADMFNKKWKKVREALGWPRCYQFYSLKDSGIRDLANAEGVVVARDQARHSDVAVTNKYIQQHEAHECTKHMNARSISKVHWIRIYKKECIDRYTPLSSIKYYSVNQNNSFTDFPKYAESFNASSVLGTNLLFSIAKTVCLLTPIASANCAWLMRLMARSTLKLLSIIFSGI